MAVSARRGRWQASGCGQTYGRLTLSPLFFPRGFLPKRKSFPFFPSLFLSSLTCCFLPLYSAAVGLSCLIRVGCHGSGYVLSGLPYSPYSCYLSPVSSGHLRRPFGTLYYDILFFIACLLLFGDGLVFLFSFRFPSFVFCFLLRLATTSSVMPMGVFIWLFFASSCGRVYLFVFFYCSLVCCSLLVCWSCCALSRPGHRHTRENQGHPFFPCSLGIETWQWLAGKGRQDVFSVSLSIFQPLFGAFFNFVLPSLLLSSYGGRLSRSKG